VTTRGGRTYAVVHLVAAVQELTSNAGGEHDTFWFDNPAGGAALHAHGAGHDSWLGLAARCEPASDPGCAPLYGEHEFIAELALHPARPADDATWMGGRLPAYDAEVIQLLPMSDEDTARARLPQIVADGMPADALVPLDHWPTRRGEQPRHVLGEHAVQGP
jgi:hypothetical protein